MQATVALTKIHCSLPDPAKCYIEARFADIKKVISEACKRTKKPEFHKDLRVHFETEASKLLHNRCTLSLIDKKSKSVIGSVRIAFETLMLAPVRHKLLLWKNDEAVGKISFHCHTDCRSLASVEIESVSIENVPYNDRKKPFLDVCMVQQRHKPRHRQDFPQFHTKKSSTWTWKDMPAMKLMAGTKKLLKTNIVISALFEKGGDPVATCAIPMAKVMEASFAGRKAEVRMRMKMEDTNTDMKWNSPCETYAVIKATRLCKYVQMRSGVHVTGNIIDGEHILPDLPLPTIEDESPPDYEVQYQRLQAKLGKLKTVKGSIVEPIEVKGEIIQQTATKRKKMPKLKLDTRSEGHVDGKILGPAAESTKGWKRLPVKFSKRPFGFNLASEGINVWVETVTQRQMRGIVIPGSKVYKINGIKCEKLPFTTILDMLKTCELPAVIKFKIPPATHNVKDSPWASEGKTKRFQRWYDDAVQPALSPRADEFFDFAPSAPPAFAPPTPPAGNVPRLPPGWETHVDPSSGRPFYRHKLSGAAQWEMPRGAGSSVRSGSVISNPDDSFLI